MPYTFGQVIIAAMENEQRLQEQRRQFNESQAAEADYRKETLAESKRHTAVVEAQNQEGINLQKASFEEQKKQNPLWGLSDIRGAFEAEGLEAPALGKGAQLPMKDVINWIDRTKDNQVRAVQIDAAIMGMRASAAEKDAAEKYKEMLTENLRYTMERSVNDAKWGKTVSELPPIPSVPQLEELPSQFSATMNTALGFLQEKFLEGPEDTRKRKAGEMNTKESVAAKNTMAMDSYLRNTFKMANELARFKGKAVGDRMMGSIETVLSALNAIRAREEAGLISLAKWQKEALDRNEGAIKEMRSHHAETFMKEQAARLALSGKLSLKGFDAAVKVDPEAALQEYGFPGQ